MKKILFTLLLVGLIAAACDDSKIGTAKSSYDNAVKRCGADNIQSHKYTDGSTDFDCSDYSKAK